MNLRAVPVPSWEEGRPCTPPRDFSAPIDSGPHLAVITASREQYAAGGISERHFVLTFMILGGPFVGQTIDDHLHCGDKNKAVQDIEYGRLSMICHATGVTQLNVASAKTLHGIPMRLWLINQARQTIITGYEKVSLAVTVEEVSRRPWDTDK